MKKKYFFLLVILLIFLFLIISISSQQGLYGSASSSGSTNPLGKLERTIGTEETSIGELIGLGKEKNGDIVAKNVKLVRGDKDSTIQIIFNEGGYVKVKGKDGNWITYSDFSKTTRTNPQKDPQIFLDKDGVVKEAYVTVNKAGKYVFENEEIDLPSGSTVVLKDGKAQILLPPNTKVIPPKKVGNSGKSIDYTFMIDSGVMEFESGERFRGKLGYYDGRFYCSDKEFALSEAIVRNPKGIKTYLDFSGNPLKIDGAYISINGKEGRIVVGSNGKDDSPSVTFSKDNRFGLVMEQTDHFAIRAMGGKEGGSYISIDNKDRQTKGLVPRAEIVGNIEMNEDNRGIRTIDGKVKLKIDGRYMNDFPEIAGTTTVPLEFEVFKIEGDKKVPLYNGAPKYVINNRLEMGFGHDPAFIRGIAYQQNKKLLHGVGGSGIGLNRLLTKGISNRISYNYLQYTKEGFERYTGVSVRMSSRVARQMTEEHWRMLTDFWVGLPDSSRKAWKSITLYDDAGFAGRASGGNTELTMTRFQPSTFRHEVVHVTHFRADDAFDREWAQVEGRYTPNRISMDTWDLPNYGFAWGYGTYVDRRGGTWEDKSTFGDLIYDPVLMASMLRDSNQYNKIYRGKVALLRKYDFITQGEFDVAFAAAGLSTGPGAVEKYIQEGKAQWNSGRGS